MKTGKKTNPHVLHVLKQMESGKACGSKPEMAVSGQKPAKRLRVKTPEKEAMQVPEMAEQASSSKPKIFIAVSPDEENAASDGNRSHDGNAASDGSAAIAASSDEEFFEISDTSEEEITAGQLKKPEMAPKKPAKSKAKAKASIEETLCGDGPAPFLGGFLQFWFGEGNKSKFKSLHPSQGWPHKQTLLLGECILGQRSRTKPGHGSADGSSLQTRLDKRESGRLQK